MVDDVNRRIGPIVPLFVLALVVTACGGDDDDAGNGDATADDVAEPDATAGDDGAEADDTAADADDGAEADDTAADADEADADEADVGDEPAEPLGGSGCRVDVTGDKTVSWTAAPSMGSVLAWYWAGESERELFGDEFTMILNCDGDGGYVGFLSSSGANEETVPFGPGSYEIPDSSVADLDGQAEAAFTALVTIDDSDTNWGPSEPGTLNITAWDDSHIAGTFELRMHDTLASLSGEESEGEIVITGSFDYPRP